MTLKEAFDARDLAAVEAAKFSTLAAENLAGNHYGQAADQYATAAGLSKVVEAWDDVINGVINGIIFESEG
jgi:hypothetical protein